MHKTIKQTARLGALTVRWRTWRGWRKGGMAAALAGLAAAGNGGCTRCNNGKINVEAYTGGALPQVITVSFTQHSQPYGGANVEPKLADSISAPVLPGVRADLSPLADVAGAAWEKFGTKVEKPADAAATATTPATPPPAGPAATDTAATTAPAQPPVDQPATPDALDPLKHLPAAMVDGKCVSCGQPLAAHKGQ
jgi:hypothetical protein